MADQLPHSLSNAIGCIRSPRQLHGISAVLLPYRADGTIDWPAFEDNLLRTRHAGLDVAVNMDTGFGDLLTGAERGEVLAVTRQALGAGVEFYAGAFTDTASGEPLAGYRTSIAAITACGATPVLVQCPQMRPLPARDKAALYARIVEGLERAIAFELSPVFAPHGEIWDEDTFTQIVAIEAIRGAKHSSLDRATEMRRLAARDQLRPDFRVYTGNDLAIDMVLYGSDYLLGLSTFAPAAFAERDRQLARDDASFLTLNDALQHLGNVGFRAPVPAYKHSAALFLHIIGQLPSDFIHPRAARRPQSDRILLFDCARRLGLLDDPDRTWAERVAPYL